MRKSSRFGVQRIVLLFMAAMPLFELILHRPWLVVIAAVLVLFMLEERADSAGHQPSDGRIATNFVLYSLGLGMIGSIGVILPGLFAAPTAALLPGFGLSSWLVLPAWASWLAFFLVDSFINYWLHRLSHSLPWLWRIHRVHHSDPAVDVSTALRSHPLELLPNYLGQLAAIAVVGATPLQALGVALVNGVWALFAHADLRRTALDFPPSLRVLVSPAYHRVHHSALTAQADSNYATMLTLWDHVFATARVPQREQIAEIGLGPGYAGALTLRGQLALPLCSMGLNGALVRPPAIRLTRRHPEAAPDPGSPGGL